MIAFNKLFMQQNNRSRGSNRSTKYLFDESSGDDMSVRRTVWRRSVRRRIVRRRNVRSRDEVYQTQTEYLREIADFPRVVEAIDGTESMVHHPYRKVIGETSRSLASTHCSGLWNYKKMKSVIAFN